MNTIVKTIRFPKNILKEIQPKIKKYNLNFTEFILNSIDSYIRELNYVEGISKSFGVWNKKAHPELEKGINNYIQKIRKGRKY